jgi:hypothetical protein
MLIKAYAGVATTKSLQRKLTSNRDVKARSAAPKLKKRHVKEPTRLPTKRMATACWAFIVATRSGRKTAPLLDFSPLRTTNRKTCEQLINRVLWSYWGHFSDR